MKTLIITAVLSIATFAKAYPQQFSGTATYQTQRHVDIALDSTSGMNSEMQKSIQEQLRKQFQKEFALTFTPDQKLWEEIPTLGKPQAPVSGMQIIVSGTSDKLYQNIKEKTYTRQSDLMGKLFLVEDELKKPEWKLEKESKNIGQYRCFKATLTEEIEEMSLTHTSDDVEKVKKERVTTAWYTLDIPVQHGPDNFWGLPGLILEVNDGKMAMMCTKVVLNPAEPITIDRPAKGKKVNQAEYDKISDEKANEMMERFHSKKSKKGDHNSFSIKIGG